MVYEAVKPSDRGNYRDGNGIPSFEQRHQSSRVFLLLYFLSFTFRLILFCAGRFFCKIFMLIQIITLVAGLLAEPILAFPTTPSTQSAKIYDNEGDLPVRLPRSNDLPINRTLVRRSNIRRRGTLSGETGLGDNADL